MNKLTKPFFLLILIGGFVVTTSCNDSDEEENFVTAEIVGTWNYNSFDYSATINGVDFLKWFADTFGTPQSTFEGEFNELETDYNEYEGLVLTFDEDGSVIAAFPGEPDDQGTWTLDEDTQTLIMNFDGESITFDVLTLNGSFLVVQLNESGEFFDLDQDGVAEVLEVVMTIGMTK